MPPATTSRSAGQKLGAGPEMYNNMSAPHNCVGGSEQGCIPEHPPVGNPPLTGSGSSLPAPASWYANGGHPAGLHTTSLGAGPEMYNNMSAPNNCVGGSETSCPNTAPVAPPAPQHWYATGNDFSVAAGQKLGAGPEMYNNMSAPHNCVGGSEQGCIPANPPVGNPALTGSGSSLPPPASWYANGGVEGMSAAKELAVPVMGHGATPTAEVKKHNASPGHILMSCHAFTLAALESVYTADYTNFDKKVAANAEAVTPVGAAVLRQHIFAK